MPDELLDHMPDELLDDAQVPKKDVRPNEERAKHASLALWSYTAVAALQVIAYIFTRQSIIAFEDGTGSLDQMGNTETIAGLITIALFLVNVGCAILFLMWFRRAYYNLGKRTKLEYTDGWAVGWWFIPIANLFKPVELMNTMCRRTRKAIRRFGSHPSTPSPDAFIGLWWAAWVISNIGARVSSRLDLDTLEDIKFSYLLETCIAGLSIVAAILCIQVIKTYNRDEAKLASLENELDSEMAQVTS